MRVSIMYIDITYSGLILIFVRVDMEANAQNIHFICCFHYIVLCYKSINQAERGNISQNGTCKYNISHLLQFNDGNIYVSYRVFAFFPLSSQFLVFAIRVFTFSNKNG